MTSTDPWAEVLRICKKHQRRVPQLRDRLGTLPSLTSTCGQLEYALQRATDVLGAYQSKSVPQADLANRLFSWVYSGCMLASSASLSCLYEAGLHGISSAEGCWIGGSNTPAPTPHSKTSEHLKLPPPTAAASTFIDRDWQQHRKLYESHNSLKLIAEELNSILRFLTKRLTAPLPGSKDAKVLLASAEDTVLQLRKENMLLLVGRRPT